MKAAKETALHPNQPPTSCCDQRRADEPKQRAAAVPHASTVSPGTKRRYMPKCLDETRLIRKFLRDLR